MKWTMLEPRDLKRHWDDERMSTILKMETFLVMGIFPDNPPKNLVIYLSNLH